MTDPSPLSSAKMSRRGVLALVSGGIIVAASAGAGVYATTRDPAAARAPWEEAGRLYDDPVRNALSYALTAPNPHNRQPWLIALHGERSATLYCDDNRLLPATDPFSRQIMIGLGCFLEVLRLAASNDGYEAVIDLFPQGYPHDGVQADLPVAQIELRSTNQVSDPLAEHILARRSMKEPHDLTLGVTADTVMALQPEITGFAIAAQEVEAFRDLAFRAHEMEVFTDYTMQESIDLMRFTRAQIEANPDGIELGGVFLESLYRLGQMTPQALQDHDSMAFQTGLDIYRELIFSSSGFVWFTTPGNTRQDQIMAGMDYVRANLKATAIGLGIHPLSQALQEYPEMDDLRAEMDEVVGVNPGERLQMFARIGYGPTALPTPRWPLSNRLINA
ncbi:MAG: twin-arginine translocation pathway signal protein [Devosiaceae bacterium]